MTGTSNPKTAQQLLPQSQIAAPIPDIPQAGDISPAALRTILTSLRTALTRLTGDGPGSALTLQRAVSTGLVRPRTPSEGGHNQLGDNPAINPFTGYGNVTWGGVTVPSPPEVVFGAPGVVESLEARAGFAGVYLTWSSADRTGGQFQVWRSETNSRAAAIRIATVTGLSYYDSTVSPNIVDGVATGKTYYYWIRSIGINQDGTIDDTSYWSGDETGGVQWVLSPDTFAVLVADNILAGKLKVVLDLDVDGGIRSGKELVGGVPNTAAGFYIDKNYFYFGAEGDGSYIRWDGAQLTMRGNILASEIRGGVIDGCTVSGTYLFARDIIYAKTNPALPPEGLYQTDYVPVPAEPYAVTRLVRNEELTTDSAALPAMPYIGSGLGSLANRRGGYAVVTTADDDEDYLILPYDYARANDTNRCADEEIDFVIDISSTAALWYLYHPFYLVGRPDACVEFTLTRYYVDDTDPQNLVYTTKTDDFYFSGASATPYYPPTDDPISPLQVTPDTSGEVLTGGTALALAGPIGTTITLSNGFTVTVTSNVAIYSQNSESYWANGAIRLRTTLTDHGGAGRIYKYKLEHRVNLTTGGTDYDRPGGSHWQVSSHFEVDNTV